MITLNKHPLDDWMKKTGRSKSEAAKHLGVTSDFILKIVSGKRNVSVRTCLRMAKITGIEKQYIMFPDLYAKRHSPGVKTD